MQYPTPFEIDTCPVPDGTTLRDLIVQRMLKKQWSLGVGLRMISTPDHPKGISAMMHPNLDSVLVPLSLFDVGKDPDGTLRLIPTQEILDTLSGFAEVGRWHIRIHECVRRGSVSNTSREYDRCAVVVFSVVPSFDECEWNGEFGGKRVVIGTEFIPSNPITEKDQVPIHQGKTRVEDQYGIDEGTGERFEGRDGQGRPITKQCRGRWSLGQAPQKAIVGFSAPVDRFATPTLAPLPPPKPTNIQNIEPWKSICKFFPVPVWECLCVVPDLRNPILAVRNLGIKDYIKKHNKQVLIHDTSFYVDKFTDGEKEVYVKIKGKTIDSIPFLFMTKKSFF